MKDYIVTVEETYFDATKFDFNKFYIIHKLNEDYKCLLIDVTPKKVEFISVLRNFGKTDICVYPREVKDGTVTIKEVETLDEVVPLSKGKYKIRYKDLYYNTCDIKTNRCYKIRIGEHIYKGFCSYRNKEIINMVVYTNFCHLACVTYDPTMYGEWNDNKKYIRFPGEPSIMHNTITNGTVMTINLVELKEDSVYFKELR